MELVRIGSVVHPVYRVRKIFRTVRTPYGTSKEVLGNDLLRINFDLIKINERMTVLTDSQTRLID